MSAARALRVFVGPDSFGGTLTAVQAADAMRSGWLAGRPGDVLDVAPLSDGGPGFVDVLAAGLGAAARRHAVVVRDPLGRPTPAHVLIAGETAYVEAAHACGLHLLAPTERDPLRADTAGVADLLCAALDAGAARIVVGLGGSGTNDAGAGMLNALGPAAQRLRAVDLVAATDVDNPLLGERGATAVFGAQKGADAAMLAVLEERVATFAARTAPELADAPGAGAAGGLGFALFSLGARRTSGADVVFAALDVGRRVCACDLVLTGEGSLDAQSLRGKLPARLGATSLAAGVPCVALAGRILLGRRQLAAAGFVEAHSLEGAAGSLEIALRDAGPTLLSLARQVASDWAARSG